MLQPNFHYIDHETGKVKPAYFSETYLSPPIAERMMMEVVIPTVENKAVVERKQVLFGRLSEYLPKPITIKQFLK